MTTFFVWLGIAVVALAAFVSDVSALRWTSIAVLFLLGGYISFGNWLILGIFLKHRRSSSMIPIFGTCFVSLAILALPFPSTSLLLPIVLVVDPWLAAQAAGLIAMALRRARSRHADRP